MSRVLLSRVNKKQQNKMKHIKEVIQPKKEEKVCDQLQPFIYSIFYFIINCCCSLFTCCSFNPYTYTLLQKKGQSKIQPDPKKGTYSCSPSLHSSHPRSSLTSHLLPFDLPFSSFLSFPSHPSHKQYRTNQPFTTLH